MDNDDFKKAVDKVTTILADKVKRDYAELFSDKIRGIGIKPESSSAMYVFPETSTEVKPSSVFYDPWYEPLTMGDLIKAGEILRGVEPETVEIDKDTGEKIRIIEQGCDNCGCIRFGLHRKPIITDVPELSQNYDDRVIFDEPQYGYECANCGHISGDKL